MRALLWCEARCDGMTDSDVDGCWETSRGEFGTKQAAYTAREDGWRVKNGEWLCLSCQKRRAILDKHKEKSS